MLFETKDKIELKVTGMTCGHCELKIEQALGRLPGVKKAAASRIRQKVVIEPDKSGGLGLQKVKEAIVALGYQVIE